VPRLIGRYDPSGVLTVAALLVGLGFGLTAFAGTPLMYAVTVLVWTLGEMLNSPSNATVLAGLAPAALRGRYQGVFSLSWSGAAFLAPIFGGLVQQHLGKAWLWLGAAGVCALVAAGHALAGPGRAARIARLEALREPAQVPAARPLAAPTSSVVKVA